MDYYDFLPPNLASLGVRRRTPPEIADLLTIRDTPYPILTRYKQLCMEAALAMYGGGTIDRPNPRWHPGSITSGYRDQVVEDNRHSPHLYAMALDIFVGSSEEQIRVAEIALQFYSRVGLYPDNGIIHVDLMPPTWVARYSGANVWVRRGGKYTSFLNLAAASAFVRKGP